MTEVQLRAAPAGARGVRPSRGRGSVLRLGNRRARRLMARNGIVGQHRRRWRHGCTKRDPRARPAPDLLDRDFTAEEPNLRWVTDITQIDTLAGACWAAVVTDVWSRRIVGWSIADHHRADLVIDALTMATRARRPPVGLIGLFGLAGGVGGWRGIHRAGSCAKSGGDAEQVEDFVGLTGEMPGCGSDVDGSAVAWRMRLIARFRKLAPLISRSARRRYLSIA